MSENKNVGTAIKSLLDYAVENNLIDKIDRIYFFNQLIGLLGLDGIEEYEKSSDVLSLNKSLEILCDHACEKGLIEDTFNCRDGFDTKIMGILMPKPSEVRSNFSKLYSQSPELATDYFYKLSQDCNYIRRDRIAKDDHWSVNTKYSELEISINLSKPEKDPRDIAAAKHSKASSYPQCLLCIENEGYCGTLSHPARQNLRIIPVDIQGEKWGFQYSPYVYYNEHCIVMNSTHIPMTIDDKVFGKLFSFVEQFPHYFIGSNADLPIVGGSILSHEHFQGGRYDLPMKNAKEEYTFEVKGFNDVFCAVLNYPMTAIRLRCADKTRLCMLASKILKQWRSYTDTEAFIFAYTGDEMHNTLTPIARMREGKYELDIVLRNNITTENHPFGVFHPHSHLHHIKKENIGLIEVQGLAILPGRLKGELQTLKEIILSGRNVYDEPSVAKHGAWVEDFSAKYSDINEKNIDEIIKSEIGFVFAEVLECAGVFKCTEQGRKYLNRFLEKLNEVRDE